MKKKAFDIQLFADEPTDGGGSTEPTPQPTEPQPNEPKPTEPANELKYTDDDVDKIVKKKVAEFKKKQQKAVDEAKRLAEMNAQEKAEYERDALQKELDELKKSAALAEMTKTARKMLSDSDISVSDELLSVMVTADADETKAAIDGFIQAFKDAVENAVKERLKGEPPRKGSGGGGAAPMTKEQIMSIKDAGLRQQKMLENKELFNL